MFCCLRGDLLAALFEAREALVDVRNARFNGGVRLGVSAHFEVILDRHLQKDVAAFRGKRYGMQLLDDALEDLVDRRVISLETALAAANEPDKFKTGRQT